MYKKYLYVLFIAAAIAAHVEGKKQKRGRRPTNEDDNTTPQPSVVSYSTFGFNDVGSFDGFVPTSPDYASYLSDNQETTTRLYAPAFPSAEDATGFNNNFGSVDISPFGNSDDGTPQSSMVQYPQSSVNFFNTPSFAESNVQNKNMYEVNEKPEEDPTGVVYGTKLNSKNNKKPNNINNFNATEFNVYGSGPLANTNDLASRFVMPGMQPQGKNTYGESGVNDQSIPNYPPNYSTSDVDEFVKSAQSNPHNALKFPRVVDFTKMKQYYPTELDNKYQVDTYSSLIHSQNENIFSNNNEDQGNKFIQPTPTLKEMTPFNTKYNEDNSDHESPKPNSYPYRNQQDYRQNYISSAPMKSNHKTHIETEYKDNYKSKWNPTNYNNTESKISSNPMKGYEYSTNYSNTSFRYDFDFDSDKKPFNSDNDELVPASSNVVDFTNYNFPESDYSNFKKFPEIKLSYDDDFGNQFSKDKYKNDEFISQFKNLYTTTPPSSQWGSFFKPNEASYKHRVKKPQFDENGNGDVVHIPKRPLNSYKYNYGTHHDSKLNEYSKQRPYKTNKFEKPKDSFNTRFKSEEDLLGLRNHDSHSYTPPHRPSSSNDLSDDTDYKRLVEKWRQSYLKSKYKDAYRERDYESYASESKPIHVPIPKPYPIEVPQPVIVPVPQPYPVRVPIPKPVAIPVIRELTVPIEKPVPYPVYKNVPYPVEKPVAVIVHKEVAVPVVKPYPVHIPHVRPVFHHSRPPREEFDSEVYVDEEDIRPRPEAKRIPPYKKRTRTTRGRPRRPTRTAYHERNPRERRRGPLAHRPVDPPSRRRPPVEIHHSSYRHRDYEPDPYESEPTQEDYYYLHCKRTGNC